MPARLWPFLTLSSRSPFAFIPLHVIKQTGCFFFLILYISHPINPVSSVFLGQILQAVIFADSLRVTFLECWVASDSQAQSLDFCLWEFFDARVCNAFLLFSFASAKAVLPRQLQTKYLACGLSGRPASAGSGLSRACGCNSPLTPSRAQALCPAASSPDGFCPHPSVRPASTSLYTLSLVLPFLECHRIGTI